MTLVYLALIGLFFRFEDKTNIKMEKVMNDYSVEFLTFFVCFLVADFLNWLF